MKILLIRFSSIGDIVLTSPVIRCIKQQIKNVELHVLIKDKFASIAHNNPNVDKVFEFQGSLNDTIKELKAEKYDYVVDLQKNHRSKAVCRALKCEHGTFHKLDFKKLLLTLFKINVLPDVHIVDRYFEAVAKLGVKNDGAGLEFFISESNALQEPDIPEEFKDGFYAVVIGGSFATKVIPTEKIMEVIKKLNPPVITAFTATASPEVLANVAEILFDGEAHIVRSESDRRNIIYFVTKAAAKKKEALRLVKTELHPMIIFCGTRNKSEDMAREINMCYGDGSAMF